VPLLCLLTSNCILLAQAMTDGMPTSGSRSGVRVESRPGMPVDHTSAISELRAVLKVKMNEKGVMHGMHQFKATI
jgi:hypothetical protein